MEVGKDVQRRGGCRSGEEKMEGTKREYKHDSMQVSRKIWSSKKDGKDRDAASGMGSTIQAAMAASQRFGWLTDGRRQAMEGTCSTVACWSSEEVPFLAGSADSVKGGAGNPAAAHHLPVEVGIDCCWYGGFRLCGSLGSTPDAVASLKLRGKKLRRGNTALGWSGGELATTGHLVRGFVALLGKGQPDRDSNDDVTVRWFTSPYPASPHIATHPTLKPHDFNSREPSPRLIHSTFRRFSIKIRTCATLSQSQSYPTQSLLSFCQPCPPSNGEMLCSQPRPLAQWSSSITVSISSLTVIRRSEYHHVDSLVCIRYTIYVRSWDTFLSCVRYHWMRHKDDSYKYCGVHGFLYTSSLTQAAHVTQDLVLLPIGWTVSPSPIIRRCSMHYNTVLARLNLSMCIGGSTR